MKREHVMRHKPGVWNANWIDMYIETTYIHAIWLLSKWRCWYYAATICFKTVGTQYVHMQSACPGRGRYGQRIYRKEGDEEERPAGIKSDVQDRRNILHKLQSCIDPMDPTNHPDELVNIVTGRVAPGTVNGGLSVQIGTAQLREFEESLRMVSTAQYPKNCYHVCQ